MIHPSIKVVAVAAMSVLLTSCDRDQVGRFVIYETANPANSSHPLVMKLDTKTGEVFWLARVPLRQTDAAGFFTNVPLKNVKGDPVFVSYWTRMAKDGLEAEAEAAGMARIESELLVPQPPQNYILPQLPAPPPSR
jgi:hypothetical protein